MVFLAVLTVIVVPDRPALTADLARGVLSEDPGGEVRQTLPSLCTVLSLTVETGPGRPEHLPAELTRLGLEPSDVGESHGVVVQLTKCQEPVQRPAVTDELVGVDVDVGSGGRELGEGGQGQGSPGQARLGEELVLPEDEAGVLLGGRRVQVEVGGEAEEGFALQTPEGVALDIAEAELHVKGGVVEVTEPVVGQRELVSLGLDGVGGQAAELSHPQDVELPAPFDLYTEHGDSLELAGEHRELLHVLEVERHGDDGLHVDLTEEEHPSHSDVFEAVALYLQFFYVLQLDILHCFRSRLRSTSFKELRMDDNSVALLHCQVLQVLHVVEQAGVELHVVTVLQDEGLSLGWRLTDILDSVLQADLECLMVVTVTVDGHPATLAPLCGTQRLGPN